MNTTSAISDFLRSLGLPSDLVTDSRIFRKYPKEGIAKDVIIQKLSILTDLEDLLHGRRSDCIRMHSNSRELSPKCYSIDFVRADVEYCDGINVPRVVELISKDSTAIIANLEQWENSVRRIVDSPSRELELEIQAHLFCTAPLSQGLNIHYDTEDNFLVQICGAKKWQLWRPDSSVDTAPDLEIVLHAGQTLYIPIGWWHRGCSLDGVSTHITFQIIPRLIAESIGEKVSEKLQHLPFLEQIEPIHESSNKTISSLLRSLEMDVL